MSQQDLTKQQTVTDDKNNLLDSFIIRLECFRGESCKYSMGKNGLHAFGYNSAESEPIWMKSRTVLGKCWGLVTADFGRDPHSGDNLRESRNFLSGK